MNSKIVAKYRINIEVPFFEDRDIRVTDNRVRKIVNQIKKNIKEITDDRLRYIDWDDGSCSQKTKIKIEIMDVTKK